MLTPATIDLRADRRTSFRATLRVRGLNLTSASFVAQVRLYGEAAGDPLIDLPLVTDSANGVKFMGVETIDGVPISTLQIQIAEATMEGVGIPAAGKAPLQGDPVAPAPLAWDLHITPSGGVKQVYARGRFLVEGGVTR